MTLTSSFFLLDFRHYQNVVVIVAVVIVFVVVIVAAVTVGVNNFISDTPQRSEVFYF